MDAFDLDFEIIDDHINNQNDTNKDSKGTQNVSANQNLEKQ
jgi:hypothetical protein